MLQMLLIIQWQPEEVFLVQIL